MTMSCSALKNNAPKWSAILLGAMLGLAVTALAQAQPKMTAPAASTGATKNTIQEAQERLQALGYQPGPTDGVMGTRATAALKRFQSDHGLTASGALDQKTLAALNARREVAAAEPTKPLAQPAAAVNEKYRVLTPDDRLSCAFSQDLSMSMGGYGLSGSVSATSDHFKCADKTGTEIEIELKSVGMVDEKVGIRTKQFGMIFRGNEPGSFDKYEMTETQIAKLKKFLGF